jgi:1-acyl-sn-glycerol-3-phosphate acyltransferase
MAIEMLLDHHRPVRAAPPIDSGPIWRAALYTLDISIRFLIAGLFNQGTIARGDALIDGYWRRIFRSGNARLMREGVEHFSGQPTIVMSNHTSLLDIPSLMGAIPGTMRMVTKEELCKLPIWGKALVKSGFVPVLRGSKEGLVVSSRERSEKAIEQLNVAKSVFHRGVHIWISPEGTRSRTGVLQAFKKGGFHLARDLDAAIMPAWIDGASAIVPPDSLKAHHDGTVTVRFGPPVPPDPNRSLEETMAVVRTRLESLAVR